MPAAIPVITVVSGLAAAAYMVASKSSDKMIGVSAFMVLFTVQFFVWGFWRMFIYPFFISPLRHLPTPPGWQLGIGHIGEGISRGLGVVGRELVADIPNEGLIRVLGPFHQEVLIATSPQVIAEVTVAKAYDFEKPQSLRDSFGPRRNLMPAFAFRHIKDLYPLFWRKAREVVQVMTEQCGADGCADIEVEHWAGRVSLDVIGVAAMGRDFGATHNENDPLVRTYMSIATQTAQDRFMLALVDTFGSIIPGSLLLSAPLPRLIEIKQAAQQIRTVCEDLIRAKTQKLRDSKLDDVDILSVAIRSGVFSEAELTHHMMTFLGAGHETTASALTFAIYALCCRPEVQTRLRDEVRAHLPSVNDDREITSLEVDRLPYLSAVINEALRLYSPVPQTIREAVRDTTIQGQRLPRGTRLLLVPWATNADALLWGADSHAFRPERWLVAGGDDGGAAATAKEAALGGASTNYAMLSFLHGPRSCIGMSFAKGEFACLLAAWIGRFEFELRDKAMMDEANVTFEQLITSKIKGGVHVRMRVIPGY
ncbi:cytochrome P450 78A3 [Cordyceps militaris CM01]|uniref:Cytochrome P450 78A3 n=1 Tax=Cordyceps militaris (strain CM01) TaxID=983644 RepID=G3JIL1_CORMM|nr:cytochrome P450 78A3 [Cordyceps militaris CM01]EGX91908.1 cytochrome P450 78A3 [Cordyceps militaris CM01]